MLSYLYKILMLTVELFMRVFPAAISFADIRQEQCTGHEVTERALKQLPAAASSMVGVSPLLSDQL